MINIETMCYRCMGTTAGGICTACGYNNRLYKAPLHHLKPGTILNGKYVIGSALGEGGFGITYIGYDLNLEMKVAIKEYYPNGIVSRNTTNTDNVSVFSGSDVQFFNLGREKFIQEAKALARFQQLPGVVSVKDFFNENGTAYIVMEFIHGETLGAFLNRNGGKVDVEIILNMMKPLIDSLIQVHNSGIIHRDISPTNIMITKDSQVKLLDFGAARDVSANSNKSLSIQLKPGYAPEEQYRTHGNQGAWTDVYALCATIYRAITGVTPVESLERARKDTLVRPSMLGVSISRERENALMCGLEVNAEKRFRSMRALFNALYIETSQSGYGGQVGGGARSVSGGYVGGQGGYVGGGQVGYVGGGAQPVGGGRGQNVGYVGGGAQPVGGGGYVGGNGNAYGGQVRGGVQVGSGSRNNGQVRGGVQRNNPYGDQPSKSQGGRSSELSRSGSYNETSSGATIAVAVCIVVAVLAVVFILAALINPSTGSTDIVMETPRPTAAPTAVPTAIPKPYFEKISASSTRGVDKSTGIAVYYYPDYVSDGDFATAWGNRRDDDPNPVIKFSSQRAQYVSGIRISNGYFKNSELYKKNRRITKIMISYAGGSKTAYLNDNAYGEMQTVAFDQPVKTSWIEIKVLESISGTKWQDIHISEIEIY